MNNPRPTGKELLFESLKHHDVPAVPWIPYAGVHAGKLRGYTAKEVLTDGDKLFASLKAVNEVYDPDGQPVLFDLQIEAEILGCELSWSRTNPPSVVTNPFSAGDDLPGFLIEPTHGRLPLVLDVMRRMKKAVGDRTALFGLVTGPLTLALHLRGVDLFTDMKRRPDSAASLLDYCARTAQRVSEFYIDAGMDVISVVDPVASQISSKHFTQFLAKPYEDIFAAIRQADVFSALFACGDATRNIEVMCRTAPDLLGVDENLDMLVTKEVTDRYNITLAGNIPLTTHMLFGSQPDNMQFALELMALMGTKNYILAPGCDMPYEIPIENVVAVLQAVRDPETTRKMVANYRRPEIDTSAVVVPDYEHLAQPLIEVFTLDSDTCAACTYMWAAAQRVAAEFAGQVDVIEYKFTRQENVPRVVKMGVKNLPSILINGELKYSSIIPSIEDFCAEVKELL